MKFHKSYRKYLTFTENKSIMVQNVGDNVRFKNIVIVDKEREFCG